MKVTTMLVILAVLTLWCQSATSEPELYLAAEAMQGFNIGMPMGISCAEWVVELKVENLGASQFRFDKVVVVWGAEDCLGLQSATTVSIDSGEPLYWELETDDIEEYEWRTNGYTYRIIGDVEDKPILFQIGFFYKDELVDGFYAAPLPDLYELPYYIDVLSARLAGEEAHGVPLVFF